MKRRWFQRPSRLLRRKFEEGLCGLLVYKFFQGARNYVEIYFMGMDSLELCLQKVIVFGGMLYQFEHGKFDVPNVIMLLTRNDRYPFHTRRNDYVNACTFLNSGR